MTQPSAPSPVSTVVEAPASTLAPAALSRRDVLRQAAQRGVDGGVVLIVGPQLKAVFLGDRQGHLQNVD